MGSLFHYLTLIYHQNQIGVADGGKSMGNDETGLVNASTFSMLPTLKAICEYPVRASFFGKSAISGIFMISIRAPSSNVRK